MSDAIQIDSPNSTIHLTIDPLDSDDNFPSFRAKIHCRIPHSASTGEFVYHADDIWFGFQEFDSFLDHLANVANAEHGEAKLCDLSQYFTFMVAFDGECYQLRMKIYEPPIGTCETTLEASCETDREFVEFLLVRFRRFPRWW